MYPVNDVLVHIMRLKASTLVFEYSNIWNKRGGTAIKRGSEYRRSDHFWTENFKISQIFQNLTVTFLLEISSTVHL